MKIRAKDSFLLLLVAGLILMNAAKHLRVTLHHPREESKEVSKCIETIAKNYLKDAHDVTILSDEPPKDTIFRIFEDLVKVLVNSRQSEPWSFLVMRKNVLVILRGEDLEEDLAVLKNLKEFYPRGSHLINIVNNAFDGEGWLWYLKSVAGYLTSIRKTAIIIMNDAKKRQARVYGYTNYSYNNCGRVSIVDYGSCETEETLKRLFRKRPNLNGCEIKLAMAVVPPFTDLRVKDKKIEVEGVETNLIILTTKMLNATVRILRDPKIDFEIEKVVSNNRVREAVARAEVDIGFGFLFQRPTEQALYMRTYLFDYTSIVMPKSEEYSLWIYIVTPLHWQIWTILIVTVLLMVILTMSVPILRKEFPVTYIIRGFFVTGSSSKAKRTSQKIYLLSWIICGYIIMQSYLASLTGLLTKPNEPVEFQTLSQLEKSNYPIGGTPVFKEVLSQTNPKLTKRYEDMDFSTYYKVFKEVIAGRKKMATHALRIHLQMARCRKHAMHHVIPEQMQFFPASALVPNTSIILEACDEIVNRILEAGLLEFWQTLCLSQARTRCAFNVQINTANSSEEFAEHAKISLVQLSVIFIIFAITMFLSSLIFLGELIVRNSK